MNSIFTNLLTLTGDDVYLEEFKLLLLERLNTLQVDEVFTDVQVVFDKVLYYHGGGVHDMGTITDVILIDVFNDKAERSRILNIYANECSSPDYRFMFIHLEDWFPDLLMKALRQYKIDMLLT